MISFSMRNRMFVLCAVSASLVGFTASRATEPNRVTPPHDAPYETSGEQTPEHAIHLSGSGRQATEKFELQAGLAIVQVQNDGKSNFVVELMDGQGEEITNLFNEIDKFQGRQAFYIGKAGTYLLDVEGTGPWSFTIEQPRPTTAEPAPQTFKGQGTDVTPFITLPAGLTVFEFERSGEGRGVFTLLDQDGRAIEQIANQLDAFQGSKPLKIQEKGVYLFNVYGEGDWTLKIK